MTVGGVVDWEQILLLAAASSLISVGLGYFPGGFILLPCLPVPCTLLSI